MEPRRARMRLWANMEIVIEDVQSVVESFDGFYRRVWPEVYRATAVTVGQADLAREATDEAMTRAYERWSRVAAMDNPAGWVYRVAVNWARSRQRRSVLALTKPAETSRVSFDDLPDPDLIKAIQKLPMNQKEVVVSRYLLDMSEAETAEAFGVPNGTIKSRLSRALQTLKEELS